MLFQNIIAKVINNSFLIKKYIRNIWQIHEPLCRIENINIPKKSVIFHIRGLTSPIKLKFSEVIDDGFIISNLSATHAGWIGYYYGRLYSETQEANIKKFDLTSDESFKKRYTIMMLNRKGELIYHDNISDAVYSQHPNFILEKTNIIKEFSPWHACYIGILAGIASKKYKNRNASNKKTIPNLKLIVNNT